ncbi:MAG TPA: DUF4199 domain-containing protein [Bacteroidales bacterium]|nr:DUF4199 domain-containing protein [Bacteroidales bacterium]
MEENVNPWKANLTSGLILGFAGIVFTLVVWILDLTFNKTVGYLFPVIAVFLLYYFIKSYRDNYLHGRITYGQSVGAGVIIYLYYSVIIAVFTYFLYKVIDPDLSNKMLAFVEEQMRRSGRVPESAIESGMAIQRKIYKPEIMAPFSIFGNMIFGTVLSLIASIFTKKEGNPLLDTPEIK